jgi:hypothetical protein
MKPSQRPGRASTATTRRPAPAPAAPGWRAEVLEVLAPRLAEVPHVHPGKMFGFPAFYAAGRLFACVYGQGVGLKLPRERVTELLRQPGFVPFQPYGKPMMREWVEIRRPGAEDYAADLALFVEAARFVARAPAPAPRRRRPRPTARR